jgi:hypothetical protein
MEQEISIAQFIKAIERLPEDQSRDDPRTWYKTQKEQWLGWLSAYNGPGTYNRKNWEHDARSAYNHAVCQGMLLYLIRAIPLRPELIESAELAERQRTTSMAKAGAIRKVVPWVVIYQALWGNQVSGIERIRQWVKRGS